jgi:hypothetical protein
MNKILIAVVAIAITGISVAFASPLFYNTEIDEPIPTGSMMEEKAMMEEKTLIYEGVLVGVNDGVHNAEGQTRTIQLDDKSQILRLEEFKSTNGPDLYVYLSTDKEATDFVNLGRLKANIGNQNYEIPQGTDLEKYNKVLIWCKAFSVLFGSAELTAKQ